MCCDMNVWVELFQVGELGWCYKATRQCEDVPIAWGTKFETECEALRGAQIKVKGITGLDLESTKKGKLYYDKV